MLYFFFSIQMDETLQKDRARHAQELQDLEDKMRNAFKMVCTSLLHTAPTLGLKKRSLIGVTQLILFTLPTLYICY